MKGLLTIKTIFLVCICTTLFITCKKDCHSNGTCEQDYRRIPLGEAKSYLYTLPGSYWIYKNTFTGALDTQICSGFILDTLILKGTRNDTKHITLEIEKIQRIITSSYNKCLYYDNTNLYNPDAIRPLRTIIYRASSKIGEIASYFFPFEINESDGTGASNTLCLGMDTSVNIQNKIYYNVAKFNIDIDGIWENSPPYTSSEYYWAKDVGLIKRMAFQKPDNWELIDYKIIK